MTNRHQSEQVEHFDHSDVAFSRSWVFSSCPQMCNGEDTACDVNFD